MKLLQSISYVLVSMFLVASCDSIGENERYIELDGIQAKRAVLLEEFTGQECPNCPEGHEVIASLRRQYGSSVIPVSIHASGLSYLESDVPGGLGIAEGKHYFENAGSPNLPAAVIDRNSGALEREDWSAKVREELEKEAEADLKLLPSFSDGSIDVEIAAKTIREGNFRLQVWVVESGIVSFQLDSKDFVMDYVHDHVLRAVVNGVSGEEFTLNKGETISKKYTISVKEAWNVNNLAIVAFISDNAGVLQAAESDVVNATND